MRKAKEPDPKPREFERFEELAKKLVAVPKSEVDKQREKYEREKAKGPANK